MCLRLCLVGLDAKPLHLWIEREEPQSPSQSPRLYLLPLPLPWKTCPAAVQSWRPAAGISDIREERGKCRG